MATQDFSRQQTRTRQALMNATVQLIIQDGYDKLTITAIVNEANYTRRAFYLHFNNIDHIIQLILVEFFLKYQQDLMVAIADLETPIREYTLWNHNLHVIAKNMPFLRQLPNLATHDLGIPVREEIYKAVMGNITQNEIKLRSGITSELLIRMEMNLFELVIQTLKDTSDIPSARKLIDDHFRLMFNQEPPDIDI